MRSAVLALAAMILGATLVAAQEPAPTPAPDPALERMRAVLQRKPLQLTPVEPEATFKIEIHAIHPMHEIFEKPLWQLDPIGWQPPGVGFNLLTVFSYMDKIKHEHDLRAAQEDVQRQIADYCAAQPNPQTIQICNARPVR